MGGYAGFRPFVFFLESKQAFLGPDASGEGDSSVSVFCG